MRSEWQDRALGEFVRLQRGHDLTASEQLPGVVPVMGSAGMNGTHSNARAKGPGVVVGRSGASIGRVHYSAVDYWPHNTCLYVTDFLGNHPRFAYYLLQTLDLAGYNSGSAQPSLNRNYIYGIKVRVPGRDEQDRIVETLQALDYRIDLLCQTNATLEYIAQALFRSWFIDFDPVRAKAEGREPEGMDAATAALFPAEFEESALGLIPKGWRAGTLADLSALNATSWTVRRAPAEVVYVDLSGVKANVFDAPQRLPFAEAPSRARRELRAGDTLVGTVRPGNRSFGFIAEAEVGLTGSTGFAVLSPRAPRATAFVYLCATRDENIDRLAALADGGAYPAVRPELVESTACVLLPEQVLSAFDSAAHPMLRCIAANAKRARVLAALRDGLLPRLISGKLRLPEAQEQLEEAVA